MKKTTKYLFAFVCAWAVFACARIEEPQFDEGAEMVEMTVTATIAKTVETKTGLEGSLEDGLLQTVWMPNDAIGIGTAVTSSDNNKFEKFVNSNTEASETGIFSGTISLADKYHAVYPYTGTKYQWVNGDHVFTINLPQTQKYVKGSFAADTAPMVATAAAGEVFEFQNVCGLLALRLKGEEQVKSITFVGKDANDNVMPVSGSFNISMDNDPLAMSTYLNWNDQIVTMDTKKSVTLVCDEPVQLSSAESTPFYFVLPPATYEKFTIIINTADGKVMMKEGKNPITIERAHAKPTAALQYAETVTIDLSAKGTANCYIVPEAGVYSFDASVIANGEFGLIGNAKFHTRNTAITPASVEVLWTDKEGSVNIISFDESTSKVTFLATGAEGNAVIAAKDSDGTILWSWHIWMTDQPAEHTYVNSYGTFTMLDRNLGAIRADRGNSDAEQKQSIGAAYQWGRKDPFMYMGLYDTEWDGWKTLYEAWDVQFTTEESVKRPNTYASRHDAWNPDGVTNLWAEEGKTIYDPCPTGYRVPNSNAFRGFSKTGFNVDRLSYFNYVGSYDQGFNFIYDGVQTAWYPNTYRIDTYGEPSVDNYTNRLWLLGETYFQYSYSDDYVGYLQFDNWDWSGNGYQVRCMKDEATSSTIVITSETSNVTYNSAKVKGRIVVYGDQEVIRTGFVYGDKPGVTLTDGTVISLDKAIGEISADITGLSELKKYYVRTFITTSKGTSYGTVLSFITPNSSGIVDLSVDGTANSYIVYPVKGTYTFDLVQGNSKTSVGNVASVEVLWETFNTTSAISVGDVIESVSLEGTKAKFSIPADAKPGNALIAAKNSGGTILWSWHIWVVDMDADASGVVYPSGSMFMDRNLGALSTEHTIMVNGYEDINPKVYGLFYQWGRKDPFVGAGDAYGAQFATTTLGEKKYVSNGSDTNKQSYATSHPTTVISDSDWNNDGTLWGKQKTINDPCPVGWRVPDYDAWNNFKHELIDYPRAGRTEGTASLQYVNQAYFLWTCEFDGYSGRAFNSWNIHFDGYNVYNEMPVRCIKDANFTVTTGEVSAITENSAKIGGQTIVTDRTTIETTGFVYSLSGDPKLHHDGVSFTEERGVSGYFTSQITGLKPGTQYYIRAYAKGGHNTGYGEVITFRTRTSGSGEGFDDDGYYDEWE